MGLGNPGPAYVFTRHNFGFLVLDHWATTRGLSFQKGAWSAEVAFLPKEGLVLLKPQTYMNLSGQAVAPWARELSLPPERVLVIHDDLDLPLGRLKFTPNGGPGGHKGVWSIMEALGTRNFPRLKLGIGRPPEGTKVPDFVLSPFTEEEWPVVKKVIARACEGLEVLLREGLQKAMSLFNRPFLEES